MEEINQLISAIRDSKLLEMQLQYEDRKSVMKLKFIKYSNPFEIKFFDIKEVLILDDLVQQEYIGQIKGLKNGADEYLLSLDPYDERIEEIEERDNYVLKFSNFEIIKF